MNMIQIILVGASVCSLIIYLSYFRSVLRDRLIISILFALTVFFILVPDSTTTIAHILGVGRGADLLIYISVTTFVFLFVLAYSRISKLERSQTDLARALALLQAKDQTRP